jgi:hypothetical protein
MVVDMAKDQKASALLQTIELIGGPWCGRLYQTPYQDCPYIQIELEDEFNRVWHYRMCEDGMFRLLAHADVFDSHKAKRKRKR